MDLQIVLTTVIAVCAFLTVLGVIFNWLLGPLKEGQAELKADIKDLKKSIQAIQSSS